MGIIRTRVADWLGHLLSESSASEATNAGSGDAATAQLEACCWMEVARQVMASYVASALQLSEVRFYRDDGHGHVRRVYEDEAWLWNVSPNPNMPRAELISRIVDELLCRDGRALVVPVRRGGRTSIYLAENFPVVTHAGDDDTFEGVSIEGSTTVCPRRLRASDVYRFDVSGGATRGWSTLMSQLDTQYQQLADLSIQAMRDHDVPKWLYRMEQPLNGTTKQKAAYEEQLAKSLRRFVQSGTPAALPLYKGQDMERVEYGAGASPVTPDLVSGVRKDMFETVAVCLRVPTSLLYGNTNNFSELVSALLTFAVDPVARLLSEEITRKTFTREEWARGCRAVVDTTHVRHVDLFEVADQVEKLVGNSIDSPNEIRSFTGQDSIPARWADEYQRTKNHESAGGGENNA
ncbi:phage portal protein [Olsenella uli]|uniref:phage portal protein n=1 Tax=Olsenella uli TaxID=133926 RepID=UPI0028E87D40|nr:phage portal protein [Olsenella uli]